MKVERLDVSAKESKYAKPLQQVLSHLFATRLKSQVYHWNVRGLQFYSMHKLLEEIYRSLDDSIDEVAERIRTIGILTISSFEEVIQFCGSENKRSDKFLDANQMIVDMDESLATLATTISEMLKREDLTCKVTEDLLIKVLGKVEKYGWLVRSFLEDSQQKGRNL